MRHRNDVWAQTLVDELVASGVDHFVVSPGSRSAPLAIAAKRSGVRLTVLLDERSAAFFALGWSKAGGLAAVLTTSGTAVANLHPAVLEADQSGAPLVVLTADRPPELVDVGANQAVRQPGIFGAAVRWHCPLGLPDLDPRSLRHLRTVACRAVATARDERGPVHINAPLREGVPDEPDAIAAGLRDHPAAFAGRTPGPYARIPPTRRNAQVPWEALDGPRGLVVAGAGAGLEASEAARHLGVPLVADGLAACPDALAHADAFLASARFRSHARPDWVLHLGASPTGRSLQAYFVQHDAVPRLRIDARGILDDAATASHLVRMEPSEAIAGLLATPAREGEAAWRTLWSRAADAACGATRAATASDWEAAIPNTLLEAARDGIVWVGSSLPVRDFDRFAHPGMARLLHNRGASGIDGVVSSAAGAAARHPDKPCLAYLGDLTFLHDAGGLAAVARHAPHLTLVVVNNGGGAIFGHLDVAASQHFEELFLAPQEVDLGKLCEAYGVQHERLHGVEPLASALRRGSAAASPDGQARGRVLEVMIDRRVATHQRRAHLAAVATAVEALLD